MKPTTKKPAKPASESKLSANLSTILPDAKPKPPAKRKPLHGSFDDAVKKK